MQITHNNTQYNIDVDQLIQLGLAKEVAANPRPGEVWRVQRTDILILDDNRYHCIDFLESGCGYAPTDMYPGWSKTMTKVANNLREYFRQKQ